MMDLVTDMNMTQDQFSLHTYVLELSLQKAYLSVFTAGAAEMV